MEIINKLIEFIKKSHFIVGLGMFLFIILMVFEGNFSNRVTLLVPTFLFYLLSKFLATLDQADNMRKALKKHRAEEKEFVREYKITK
ncbi:hypothetical protein HZC07_03810 [Candidatus Micrarchaeota archaeon]|nr:hypothetical protein [Candidatus Micrarchaeota archaeon]